MNKQEQKSAFLSYEANAWFSRNKSKLGNYNPEEDRIITLLKNYKINPQSVLEIGSSAGYRLNAIKNYFGSESVIGVEPSKDAINFGKKEYPEVSFIHGTMDNIDDVPDSSCDLVIVGFVFYVVDRAVLLKSVAEIDRVLKNSGMLVITDFYSEKALKNNYHHISEFNAYSYKQDYYKIFESTHMYHLLDKSTYNHATMELNGQDDFHDLISITVLRKDVDASYQ